MKSYFIKIKSILILLYSIQGLIFNFILDSLIFLQKKDLSYSEIGMIKFCNYPFSLKLLWSPLVDTYYFKSIGRRKTWIIPCQILIMFGLYYLYLNYDLLMMSKSIVYYTFVCFSIIFLLATQDIALDGWALEICREKSVLASACQTIGHKIGSILSVLVFIQLNSIDFCNKWIYSERKDRPILCPSRFFMLSVVYVGLATVIGSIFPEKPKYEEEEIENEKSIENDDLNKSMNLMDSKDVSIHTHIKTSQNENNKLSQLTKTNVEGEKKDEEEGEGLIKTIKNIILIIKLPHFKKFLCLILSHRLGFCFFYFISGLILIDKGFSKESMALIGSILIPMEIVVVSLLEKKKNNFFITYTILYKLKIIICIVELVFLCFYKEITNMTYNNDFLIVLIISISNSIVDNLMTCCNCGFYNSITDLNVGATYITALYSIQNLSAVFPSYFIFALTDKIGFSLIGLFSVFYSALFYFAFLPKLVVLESLGKEIWKIGVRSENEIEKKKKIN